MEEQRIERALHALARAVPRTPEKTVRDMARTVRALEQERNRRAGKTAEPEKTVQRNREMRKTPPKAARKL